EQYDRDEQARHVVDQEQRAPAGGPAVELVFNPQRAQYGGGDREGQADRIIAGLVAPAGEIEAEDRENGEHRELDPEGQPGSVFARFCLRKAYWLVHRGLRRPPVASGPVADYIDEIRSNPKGERWHRRSALAA